MKVWDGAPCTPACSGEALGWWADSLVPREGLRSSPGVQKQTRQSRGQFKGWLLQGESAWETSAPDRTLTFREGDLPFGKGYLLKESKEAGRREWDRAGWGVVIYESSGISVTYLPQQGALPRKKKKRTDSFGVQPHAPHTQDFVAKIRESGHLEVHQGHPIKTSQNSGSRDSVFSVSSSPCEHWTTAQLFLKKP